MYEGIASKKSAVQRISSHFLLQKGRKEDYSRPARGGQYKLQTTACLKQLQQFFNFVMPSGGQVM